MFKILDGRSHFWQWDSDQKLVVESLTVGTSVQFYNDVVKERGYTTLVRQEPGKRICDVPNILLTHACDLTAYAYVEDEKGNRTVFRKTFKVKKREKPAAYVYKETEVTDYPKVINDALALAKKSGMFDGEDGVSPVITTTRIGTGTRVTITDAYGDKRFDILNGKDGAPGAQGEPGKDGAPGPQGLPGKDGKDGVITFEDLTPEQIESLRGPAGADGKDGETPEITIESIENGFTVTIGDKGFTVYNGKDGVDGIPGADGKDGVDGEPGPQGEPGKDGSDYILTEEDMDEIAAMVPDKIPAASQDVAGVVKVNQTYGTRMVNGVLDLMPAQNSEIDKRAPNEYPLYLVTDYTRHMIVPANVDYAVKKALADNKIANTSYAWTDEEKASARELLGITEIVGDIEAALDELHTYAQSLIDGGTSE